MFLDEYAVSEKRGSFTKSAPTSRSVFSTGPLPFAKGYFSLISVRHFALISDTPG